MRCRQCEYYIRELNICPLMFKQEKNINYEGLIGCQYTQNELTGRLEAYDKLTQEQKQLCNIFMVMIENNGLLPYKYETTLKKPNTVDLCNDYIWLHIEYLLQSNNFNHVINSLTRLDLLEDIFPQYYSLLEYTHITDNLMKAFSELSTMNLDIQIRRFITWALLFVECGIPKVNKAKRKTNKGHEQLGMDIIEKSWYHYQCPYKYIKIAKMCCKLHEVYIKIDEKQLKRRQLYDLVDFLTKFSNEEKLNILYIVSTVLNPKDTRIKPSFDVLRYVYNLLYHKKIQELPEQYSKKVFKYQVGSANFYDEYKKQKALYMEQQLKENDLYVCP